MNLLIIVDLDGYFTFVQGGFKGHLTDASVYHYCQGAIPRLPAGLHMLADSGFPAGGDLIVPARARQLPENIRRPVNRYIMYLQLMLTSL
jgi:hypothetical protein